MSFLSSSGRKHGASPTARRISEAFTFGFGDLRHTLGCQPLCLSPGGPHPVTLTPGPLFPSAGSHTSASGSYGSQGGSASREQRVGSASSSEAGGPRAAHAHGEPVREPRRVRAGAPSTLCVLGARVRRSCTSAPVTSCERFWTLLDRRRPAYPILV